MADMARAVDKFPQKDKNRKFKMKKLLFYLEVLAYISIIALEVWGCYYLFNKLMGCI